MQLSQLVLVKCTLRKAKEPACTLKEKFETFPQQVVGPLNNTYLYRNTSGFELRLPW